MDFDHFMHCVKIKFSSAILAFMLYSKTPFSLFSVINNGSHLGRINWVANPPPHTFDTMVTF